MNSRQSNIIRFFILCFIPAVAGLTPQSVRAASANGFSASSSGPNIIGTAAQTPTLDTISGAATAGGQRANLFQVFLKHKQPVKMVTLRGVNDAASWRADGGPLLFDGGDKPKPIFDAIIRLAEDAKGNAR